MDRSASSDAAAGKFELRPCSETLSCKAIGQCIPTRKSRSTQSRRHSDFRTAVESIGPAPAQFIYCAASDKMRTQIINTLAFSISYDSEIGVVLGDGEPPATTGRTGR
jgi:hypothetical protein